MQTGDLLFSKDCHDICNSFSTYNKGTKPNPVSTVFAIIHIAKAIKRAGFGLVVLSIFSMVLPQLFYAILWPC